MEFFIIILGILLDRITKIWAVSNLKESTDIVILRKFFSLSYLENVGAAFGILQNKQYFLIIITLIIILAMLYYIMRYKPKSKVLKISLALVISGALGNLIDRIMYKYVVDFISVHYKDVYYFPTFNIADILVVLGAILLSIYSLRDVS